MSKYKVGEEIIITKDKKTIDKFAYSPQLQSAFMGKRATIISIMEDNYENNTAYRLTVDSQCYPWKSPMIEGLAGIKVKKLREDIELPTYGSELASGFDVRAYACQIWNNETKQLEDLQSTTNGTEQGWLIPSNKTVIFKTGLAVACNDHEEVQARARSGFSLKTPMRISNGVGTIDEDYRGEVGIIMDNNGQYGDWFVPYAERIAQLVVCPVIRPTIFEVNDLDETDRGSGGYGSTGTK